MFKLNQKKDTGLPMLDEGLRPGDIIITKAQLEEGESNDILCIVNGHIFDCTYQDYDEDMFEASTLADYLEDFEDSVDLDWMLEWASSFIDNINEEFRHPSGFNPLSPQNLEATNPNQLELI